MREGWTYKKLGDYIKEYSVKNKVGKDIPVYSVTNSQGFCKEYFSKEVASQDKTSYKIVPYGFFAFNPSRINVGSVDWQHKEEEVIVSPLYNVFSVSENILQPYLLYYLKSPATIKYIDSIATGTVRLNLKLSMLKDFSIPVPSLSEQQAIVSELDKINELISLKKAQLSDLDNLAQSIFYDMFGDPIENEKGWEVKKLDSIYKVTSSKRVFQEEWKTEGIPFYKVADIVSLINDEKVIPNTFITEAKYNELKLQSLVPNTGDILVTSRGTLGQCYIVKADDQFYFQDGMITWLSAKKVGISPIYIKMLFKTESFLNSLLQKANISTVAYLSINQLANRFIPIPPLPLQQEFAKRIELIEQQKTQINSTIKDLETLLASRMQHWFD